MFNKAKQEKQPEPFEVAGKALSCQVCGHDLFWPGGAVRLHQFGLPKMATAKVCAQCGYVHSFALLPD